MVLISRRITTLTALVLFLFLTENVYSVVGADRRPPLGLDPAAVAPFIAPRQPRELQVVVPSLERRPRCDLLTVLKPRGCRRRTPRDDALQRQRLPMQHRNRHRSGGINYPNQWGGGGGRRGSCTQTCNESLQ